MKENNFAERYKTWKNSSLLEILDRPNDFQPLAVEAARAEIERRQLTQEQLESAKSELLAKQLDEENKKQKIKSIGNKIKFAGESVLETINPVKKEKPTTDKLIILISLFIGGVFLYQLFDEFDLLKFMLTSNRARWDVEMVYCFLPLLVLPLTAIFFWLRKKTGWMLAMIYSALQVIGAVAIFFQELHRKSIGIPALDRMFPPISPMVYIGTFVLFGGLIATISKEDIRLIYKIDKKAILIAIAVTAFLSIVTMYRFLNIR